MIVYIDRHDMNVAIMSTEYQDFVDFLKAILPEEYSVRVKTKVLDAVEKPNS
jgi:hypothetical protein